MTQRARAHSVAVTIGGVSVENWTEYEIENDMLSPADGFSMTRLGLTRDEYAALALDEEIQVFLDDTRILSGFVDTRNSSAQRSGLAVQLQGRDRMSRVLDEAAPLIGFDGLGIVDLAKLMVEDWIPNVITSNAVNRRLVRGGSGAKMGAIAKEPGIQSYKAKQPRKVQPGDSRWIVLSHFLRDAGLLAWSTADGYALVIGKPNYDQAPTFSFFQAAQRSSRVSEVNVLSISVEESVQDRYSQITCVAMGQGDETRYHSEMQCRGEAFDGTGRFGIGRDFKRRKVMILVDDDMRTNAMAKQRAEREMAERNFHREIVTVTVPGHSQWVSGGRKPTIYACDTMARLESESLGVEGLYLISAVSFSQTKREGERTRITLVPKGTDLHL